MKKKIKQKEAGRPTELTDELFVKIKQSILNGNDLGKTADVCKISKSTFYTWHSDNYLKLADKIEGWKRDRKIMLAAKNVDEILQINVIEDKIGAFGPIKDPDTKKRIKAVNTGILKIKADVSTFVLETLDKDNYSKRNEMTGKNGADLIPKPLLGGASNVKPNVVSNNNSNNQIIKSN